MRKKVYVLLVYILVTVLFIACSNKNERKMDKILKEKLAGGKTAELIKNMIILTKFPFIR